MGFLNKKELTKIGFRSLGNNVMISDKASFYSPDTISIGSNVRIDDFCILSGNITLGNYIHISAFCGLYGKGGIAMDDFSGLSPRCTLFSASDDFSGRYMIGPMVPNEYTNVEMGQITIGMHAQIGAGSVILPNVNVAKGSVIGAMSFVNKDTEDWKMYAGAPIKYLKQRKKGIKKFSENFLKKT
jgi:galactoside O-acetyltransferase